MFTPPPTIVNNKSRLGVSFHPSSYEGNTSQHPLDTERLKRHQHFDSLNQEQPAHHRDLSLGTIKVFNLPISPKATKLCILMLGAILCSISLVTLPSCSKRATSSYTNQSVSRNSDTEGQLYRDAGTENLDLLSDSNSLDNGASPYEEFYGKNYQFLSDEPHATIQVTAPRQSDLIVIVRYDNHEGEVAGHIYVRRGQSSSIQLPSGRTYQTFFYCGIDWSPDKPMPDKILGGFTKAEVFSKDGKPSKLKNNILSYTLSSTGEGNFTTTPSSAEEMF